MYTFLVVLQVLAAVAVIGLVLIQHGKGADAGAAFGSGASGTVFGSRGSANFLTRATAASATVFFLASLALAYLVQQGRKVDGSVIDKMVPAVVVPATTETPAVPPGDTAVVPGDAPAVTPVPAEQKPEAPKVPE